MSLAHTVVAVLVVVVEVLMCAGLIQHIKTRDGLAKRMIAIMILVGAALGLAYYYG
jgi:hypothetical protein